MTVPAMVSKRGFAALAVAVVASTVAATAGAAPDPASPTRVTAVLRSETTGYPWRGRFYARIAQHRDRAELNFNSTYTWPPRWPYPGTAHIHLGRPGNHSRVLIELCPASAICGRGFVYSESFRSDVLAVMRTRGGTWSCIAPSRHAPSRSSDRSSSAR
jgi:hypothetical protein